MNTDRILYFASILVVVGYLLYLLILSLSNIGFYVRVLGWKSVALLGLLYAVTGLIGLSLGRSKCGGGKSG